MARFLLVVAIAAGAVVALNATCQHDFETCKKSYEDQLPSVQGHPGALCLLGNKYIDCLRNLTSDASCGNLTHTITEEYKKEEQFLGRNVTGCMRCMSEIDKCDEAFKNAVAQAGHNITAVCAAGTTMDVCLERVDDKPECAPEKSRLERERRKAMEKMNEAGCGGNGTCLVAFQACQAQYNKDSPNAKTHAQQCKVAKDYYNCMAALQCTGQYEKDVKTAMDMILKQAKDSNCPFATGAASLSSPMLGCVVAALVVVAATIF